MTKCAYEINGQTVTGYDSCGHRSWSFDLAQIIGSGYDTMEAYEGFLVRLGYVPRVAEEAPKTDWVAKARARVEQKRAADPAYERVRPPLTWATPKPVDRWEGFTVERFDADDLMPAGPDYDHPLQRMTDPSDPLHGSAWLKVR